MKYQPPYLHHHDKPRPIKLLAKIKSSSLKLLLLRYLSTTTEKQLIILSRRIHPLPIHSAHMSLNSLGKLVHRTRGSLPSSLFTEGVPYSSSASHLPCCSPQHESQKVIMLEVQTFNSTRLNKVKRQRHNKDIYMTSHNFQDFWHAICVVYTAFLRCSLACQTPIQPQYSTHVLAFFTMLLSACNCQRIQNCELFS